MYSLKNIALLFTFFYLSACTGTDSIDICESITDLPFGNNTCLVITHDQLPENIKLQIEKEVSEGLGLINSFTPVKDLQIRIVNDPQLIIPEIGMGGYNPNKHEILISLDPESKLLVNRISKYLIPLLAHEIHHAMRRRSVGYGATLLEAMVSEGLADHYSMEVSGIRPPPWSVALSDEDLILWAETARGLWYRPYNHRAWFLGSDESIPRWTGYSVGFSIVGEYLENNPDKLPSALIDEPAQSFIQD